MLVYRIESKGYGIYCERGLRHNPELHDYVHGMAWQHTDNDLRPDGYRDGLGVYRCGDYRFACPSLELLKQWFEGHLETLKNFPEVSIFEIEVEDSIISDSGLQCVFRYDWEIRRNKIEIQ